MGNKKKEKKRKKKEGLEPKKCSKNEEPTVHTKKETTTKESEELESEEEKTEGEQNDSKGEVLKTSVEHKKSEKKIKGKEKLPKCSDQHQKQEEKAKEKVPKKTEKERKPNKEEKQKDKPHKIIDHKQPDKKEAKGKGKEREKIRNSPGEHRRQSKPQERAKKKRLSHSSTDHKQNKSDLKADEKKVHKSAVEEKSPHKPESKGKEKLPKGSDEHKLPKSRPQHTPAIKEQAKTESPKPVDNGKQKVSLNSSSEFDDFKSSGATQPETVKQIKDDLKGRKLWKNYLEKCSANTFEGTAKPEKPNPKILKELAKRGIPNDVRGMVWMNMLGVKQWRAVHSPQFDFYGDIYGCRFLKQIDLDIRRTHRNHVLFHKRYSQKQCSLFHGLRAYSIYQKDIGYTQGMSIIYAVVLMYINDDETVFWLFDTLMQKHGLKEIFRPGFDKLQENFFILKQLTNTYLPKLGALFDHYSITPSSYSTKWFLTVFMDLKFDAAIRVWDLFVYLGYNVVFCVGLAVLHIYQEEFMELEFEDLMLRLTTLSKADIDIEKLMKLSVKYYKKIFQNSKVFTKFRDDYFNTKNAHKNSFLNLL